MKKILIFVFVLLIIINLFGADLSEVQRKRAILRRGPGSFYKIIAELQKGTPMLIVDKEEGWLKVEVFDSLGYVSKKVLIPEPDQTDMFSKMATQDASLRISQHGMSAGVKGFADKFIKKFDGNRDFFQKISSMKIDPYEYKKFKKRTYKGFNKRKNFKKLILPESIGKGYFTFSEEGIGIGIASRIASLGIYENEKIEEYLNILGNVIVEATDAYDISFKFFILDTAKINAYACPGGFIFITKGLLQQINTEAELAFVLAHEIAHVIRQHGMKELEERKQHIMADDVFGELDEELNEIGETFDEETENLELEMEEFAVETYDTIFNGRLENYEAEADYLGLLYAARAGYDIRQVISLLNRLILVDSHSTNEHYEAENLAERLEIIRQNPHNLRLPKKLFDHKNRWQEIRIYLN